MNLFYEKNLAIDQNAGLGNPWPSGICLDWWSGIHFVYSAAYDRRLSCSIFRLCSTMAIV